jgi:hypothetical protein
VSRRDVEDGVGRDIELLPIVHEDVQDAGDGVPEVVDLAVLGAYRACDVDVPSLARTPARAADGRLAEADDLGVGLREPADLVGMGEVLDLETGHEGPLSHQAMRRSSSGKASTDLYHVH